MDASLLRDEILLQNFVETRDTIGGTTETWDDWETVYAYARSVRSQDRYASARNMAVESYEFVIRWLEDLDPKMQIVYRSKTYRITGIEPYDDRAWIKILAEAYEQGALT